MSDARPPLVLLIAGLALNLLVVALLCCNIAWDSVEYVTLARNLAAVNVYSLDAVTPSGWRLPVYPLILAGLIKLFGSHESIYYLQAIINTCTLLIVYRIARRLSPQTSPYLIVLSTLLLSLPLVASSAWLLTESVNAFLVCAAFLLLLKERYVFAGILFGLAALCRVENVVIALVLIILLRNLRHSLAFALPLVLILTPWLVRNYSIYERVTLTDPAYTVFNLAVGTSPEGVNDPLFLAAYRFRDGGTNEERKAYTSLVIRTYFERWREHPLSVLALKLRRMLKAAAYSLDSFLSGDRWAFGRLLNERRYAPALLRLLVMILYGPVFLGLALIGFLRCRRARRLVIPFAVMMTTGFVSYIEQRYLIASQLLLIPLFVIGAESLIKDQIFLLWTRTPSTKNV
ncbi:MAG TPA: hypothetical protein VF735_13510 [Pyrinomonadaceae bacterium]